MQADAVLILQDRHELRATAAARTSVEPAETIVAYATDAGIEVSACGRTAAGWRNCCWTASPKASYDPHHLPCLSSNVSGASRSPDRLADPVERFGPARPCPAPNDNVTREVDKSDGDVRIVKEVR